MYNFGSYQNLQNAMPGLTEALQNKDFFRAEEEMQYKTIKDKSKGLTDYYFPPNNTIPNKRAVDNIKLLQGITN